MKKANSFYKWFTGIGGEVANLNIENVYNALNKIDVQISSFKHRAQEVKEQHNYKFNL